ncbi:unnamed protein product, partial [Symbiodinium microadriaticum]
ALLGLSLALFVLVEAVVALVYGVLLLAACCRRGKAQPEPLQGGAAAKGAPASSASSSPSSGSDKAALNPISRGKPAAGDSSDSAKTTPDQANPVAPRRVAKAAAASSSGGAGTRASRPRATPTVPAVDPVAAIADAMGRAMLVVAMLFFASLSLLALYDVTREECVGRAGPTAAGWLVLGLFVAGLLGLVTYTACSDRPFHRCRGCCGVGPAARADRSRGAFAYQGSGVRAVDATGRLNQPSLAGRAWQPLLLLDQLATAGVLVGLSDRPGAQAGVLLGKQVLLLALLLSCRPAAAGVPTVVMTL